MYKGRVQCVLVLRVWCTSLHGVVSCNFILKFCVLTLDLSQVKRFNVTKRAIEGIIIIYFLICRALQLSRAEVSKLGGEGGRLVYLGCLWASDHGQNVISGFFPFTLHIQLQEKMLQLWKKGSQYSHIISFFAIYHDKLTSWKEHFQILTWNCCLAKNQNEDQCSFPLNVKGVYQHIPYFCSTAYCKRTVLSDQANLYNVWGLC